MNAKAKVLIDANRKIATISSLLFGGFAEHMVAASTRESMTPSRLDRMNISPN
jgi:hypothetical protein